MERIVDCGSVYPDLLTQRLMDDLPQHGGQDMVLTPRVYIKMRQLIKSKLSDFAPFIYNSVKRAIASSPLPSDIPTSPLFSPTDLPPFGAGIDDDEIQQAVVLMVNVTAPIIITSFHRIITYAVTQACTPIAHSSRTDDGLDTVLRTPFDLDDDQIQRMLRPGFDQLPALFQSSIRTLVNCLIHNPQGHVPFAQRSPHMNPTVWIHPARLALLSKVYPSDDVHFESPKHAAMLEHILQDRYHVVGILPTTRGKNLILYGPSFAEPWGVTMLVTPFTALCRQQYEEAETLGIKVALWPCPTTNLWQLRLLIIPAEYLRQLPFLAWFFAASRANFILRVIFDEAHEILFSKKYRDSCHRFAGLLDRTVKIHFLTARLYYPSIPKLVRQFGINIQTICVVSAAAAKRNLYYQVRTFEMKELRLAKLLADIQDACGHREPEDRFIVYSPSPSECAYIAEKLGAVVYKPTYEQDEGEEDTNRKAMVREAWMRGDPPVVVATSPFSDGVDYLSVSHVFINNPPDMIRLHQQCWQAGRSGQEAKCLIYADMDAIPSALPDGELDHGGVCALRTFFAATNTCRRVGFETLDGETSSCYAWGAVPCDYCMTLEDEESDIDLP